MEKEPVCFLKDLKPNMKRVNSIFMVLDVGQIQKTRDGSEVRTVRVADRTGSINLSVWNEKAAYINPADVLQLKQGNTLVRNGCMVLNVNKQAQLVKIAEFCYHIMETPDFSAYREDWDNTALISNTD